MAYLSASAVRAHAPSGVVGPAGPRRARRAGQVRQAVAAAIRAFGCSGCAGRVAQEFGDHPETAVIRMRWSTAWSARRSRIQRRSPAGARACSVCGT